MLFNLLCLIGLSFGLPKTIASPQNLADLSGKVIGTVISACDHPTFYTHRGHPYPDNAIAELDTFWLNDPSHPSDCFSGPQDVLKFCRRVYGPKSVVDRVVSDPFSVPLTYLPTAMQSIRDGVRVYLCLGPASNPSGKSEEKESMIGAETQSPPLAPTGHLPSLIDVHRAYFTDKLRRLLRNTKTNVTLLTTRLVQEARGLVQLYQDKPQRGRYAVSQLLKRAHADLERTWTQEEVQWNNVEEEQHEDLARLMEQEDWAEESKFAYVLQEPHVDLNRTQNALTQLLSHLTDSVNEELRHLQSVQANQPWAIRLQAGSMANWTATQTAGVVSLEQVHRVLLKHVRTATLAINTLRSLMTNQTTSSLRSNYLPSLIVAYDGLQSRLSEAQLLLNTAKSHLVGHLTHRMQSLLHEMHEQLKPTNSDGSSSEKKKVLPQEDEETPNLHKWLESKHHAELAYLDLLVTQLFRPYNNQGPTVSMNVDLTDVKPLNEAVEADKTPWQPSPNEDATVALDPAFYYSPPSSKTNLLGIHLTRNSLNIILIGAILSGLLLLSTLLYCCLCRYRRRVVRRGGDQDHPPTRTRLRPDQWRRLAELRAEKLQHWFLRWPLTSFITAGKPEVTAVPVWKVGRPVVVVGTGPVVQPGSVRGREWKTDVERCELAKDRSLFDPENSVHGYLNPIYPEADGR